MDTDNLNVKYLVLDILKPHKPSIVELSKLMIKEVDNISRIKTEIVEIDQDTESIKMSVYGEGLDVEVIKRVLRKLGASLHSVDVVEVERV